MTLKLFLFQYIFCELASVFLWVDQSLRELRAWILAAGFSFLFAATAVAEERDPMLLVDRDGFKVRAHLQFGLNAVAETNLFWDLAATTAPGSGFDPDTEWLEGYVKPGVSFENTLGSGGVIYGKLSAVTSYTWGTDAFDTGDTGATTLEEAYLAFRNDVGQGLSYDVSLGARELTLGTGMLIANGATSGFERGALKFGPRKAWEMAAIGRVTFDTVTGTLFYLDPNELPSTDGSNELAGIDLRRDSAEGGYLGATFVSVLNSNSPYPQIGGPPATGARDGTNTVNVYAQTNRFSGTLENWTFTSDLAYQWNDDFNLAAYAGRVTAEYKFQDIPWSPSVKVGYQTFSGDDPDTDTYERFDPLYYQGSPSTWATGSKSASTFINSNVNALSLTLQVKPTQKD
ncbi:MAG: alginate export family protein, partial [Pseudomonadota bacterium]